MVTESQVQKHILRGEVVSDKMDKTIVVKVERTYKHPHLKKVMRSFKRYKVHDENESAKVGDIVDIYEGKPVSKTKYMYLSNIVRGVDNSANELKKG